MRPVDLSDLRRAVAVAAVVITATVSAHAYTQRDVLGDSDDDTLSSARVERPESAMSRSATSSLTAERAARGYQTN
jgi:hypothetical protein